MPSLPYLIVEFLITKFIVVEGERHGLMTHADVSNTIRNWLFQSYRNSTQQRILSEFCQFARNHQKYLFNSTRTVNTEHLKIILFHALQLQIWWFAMRASLFRVESKSLPLVLVRFECQNFEVKICFLISRFQLIQDINIKSNQLMSWFCHLLASLSLK